MIDTTSWENRDEFPVLDLVARFQFRTTSSVSFQLGQTVDRHSPRLPEMEPGEERIDGGDKWDFLLQTGSMFVVLGWLDAHHPCDGFHRLQLRVGLPDRYVRWESLRELVPKVKAVLGLPADEPYHVMLSGLSQRISIEEPQSGFVSTTRWQPSS